jgi:segregation and condensation protein B
MSEIASEEQTPAESVAASAPDDVSGSTAPKKPRESRPEKIRDGVEAILFSSARPVSEADLANVLEATPDAVRQALASLAADADTPERGVRLEKVGGGWRYVTRPEFDSLLRKFHEVSERSRLSLAALETLAIIAYRQPITLPEVQEIRGVNSSSVLKTLFEKKLITTAGKKAVVGTPFLYKTTPDFLVRFGLNDLEELPRPEEIEEDLAATVPEDQPPAVLPPTAEDFHPSGETDDDEDDGEDEEDSEGETPRGLAAVSAPRAKAADDGEDPDDDEDEDEDEDDDQDDDDEDDEDDEDDA